MAVSDAVPSEDPRGRGPLRRALRAAAYLASFFALLVPTIYWVEAEKEAHILCGMVRSGASESEMERLFGTAELLRVTTEVSGDTRVMRAATPAPIGHESCEIRMRDGAVSGISWKRHLPTGTVAFFALLIGLPVSWRARPRGAERWSVPLGIGIGLLAVAAVQRSATSPLDAAASFAPVVLGVALLASLGTAVWSVARAQVPTRWSLTLGLTVIALACSVLLLDPPRG